MQNYKSGRSQLLHKPKEAEVTEDQGTKYPSQVGHIFPDPLLTLLVPLESMQSDHLSPRMVTQTKVTSKAQRYLQRAVACEPGNLKNYLSMKLVSFGWNLTPEDVWCGMTLAAQS